MKPLQESILDDNFVGEDLPVVTFGNATVGHDLASDIAQLPLRYFMKKNLTPQVIRQEFEKIIPDGIFLRALDKGALIENIWDMISETEQEHIKERARDWFMSQLNLAGQALVKAHGFDVLLKGRSYAGPMGYRSRLIFKIGETNVIVYYIAHNNNWAKHIKKK